MNSLNAIVRCEGIRAAILAAAVFGFLSASLAVRAAPEAALPKEAKVSIHLFAGDGILVLKPGKVVAGSEKAEIKYGNPAREDKGKGVLLLYDMVGEDWRRIAFTFTSDRDGEIELRIRGDRWKPGENMAWVQRYVYADDVAFEADGKPLDVNGGFERGRPTPEGWKLAKDTKAEFLRDPKIAHDGEVCAVVSVHDAASRTLKLKSGVVYTVGAWFRSKADGVSLADPKKGFYVK